MSYNDGQSIGASAWSINAAGLPSFAATTDGFSVCPPSEFTTTPVTNITYSNQVVAGPSGTTISVLQAACATAAATAKIHLDLTDLICRATTGKGATITALSLVYTVTGAALATGPALAVASQTFGSASATAAAPTAVAAAGGTLSSTPATPPTGIPTAGQFYTVTYTLGTPLTLNNPLQRAYAEITVAEAVGSNFQLAAASVAFNNTTY